MTDKAGNVIGIINSEYSNLEGHCATFATAITEANVLLDRAIHGQMAATQPAPAVTPNLQRQPLQRHASRRVARRLISHFHTGWKTRFTQLIQGQESDPGIRIDPLSHLPGDQPVHPAVLQQLAERTDEDYLHRKPGEAC